MLRFIFFFFGCGVLLLAGMAFGCTREYSFEGRDTINIPLPQDTATQKDTAIEQMDSCAGCSNAVAEGQWSLKLNGALLCGVIDTAIASPGRNGFTFFGPSFCSPDSGLIITVRLENEMLDQNRQNLQLYKCSLNYYDNVGGSYVAQSQQGKPFYVIISSYNHATKKAEGTFSGTGYTNKGKTVAITEGKWKTHLH